MKFITSMLLTAFLSIAASLYLPWWIIAVVAFIVAVAIPQKPGISFLAGFLALYIGWGLLTFYISNANEHLLAHKVSVIILTADNPYALILLTAAIGALVAGLGALTGSFVRKLKPNI